MADIPGFLLTDRVDVETYLGDSSEGPRYAQVQLQFPARLEGTLTVDGNGQYVGQVKMWTRRYYAPQFPARSRVHTADGGVLFVQTVADRRDGGLGAWQHLELVLGPA